MTEDAHRTDIREQARIASFAAERLTHKEDADYLLRNIGALAAGNVTRITKNKEYIQGDDGPIKIMPGTERQVATGQDYIDYLVEVGDSKYEPIAQRAELLAAYEDFGPLVHTLQEEVKGYDSPAMHPDYLAAGLNAKVFSLSQNGHEYVARVPHSDGPNSTDEPNPSAVDYRIRAGMRGKGIPHLEQIVAFSYEDGVVISERMPGRVISKVTAEELGHVTDKQLNDLIDTFIAAHKAGIHIDPRPSNYFYDKEQGFGIVDYDAADEQGVVAQNRTDMVSWAETIIGNAGTYGFRPETSAGYHYLKEQASAQLQLLERYKAMCAQRFSGEDADVITHRIEKRIGYIKDTIADYSNPDWVSDKIAAGRRQKSVHANGAVVNKDKTVELHIDTV